MKKFFTEDLGEDCGICGPEDGCSLKVARAMTKKVLDKETLHFHKSGTEYYFFISGKVLMVIGEKTIEAKKGDLIIVDPGENHMVKKIVEEADYIVVNTDPDPKDRFIDDKKQ